MNDSATPAGTDAIGDRQDRVGRLEADLRDVRAQLDATQHRVRNTLSVIRAIARVSARTSETVEDYAMHLDGRIGAFARVQGALLRDPGAGMPLDTLVADTLATVLVREGDRLRIGGPPIVLRAKAAEMLGLALHELATNAVKFGALSWPDGRITVAWQMDDGPEPRLALSWEETGAPEPVGAARRGFGTEMLERTLGYELGARTALDYTPEGLTCRIDLPLEATCPPVSGCSHGIQPM